MHIAFHANPAQPHQIEHSQWFSRGLAQHGLGLTITSDPCAEADIHIISGPHYAYNQLIGKKNVLMIDRAYWHDEMSGNWKSMDYISLGWLKPDGGRIFCLGDGRPSPTIRECHGKGSIFLADYDGPIKPADTVRLHPATSPNQEPLISVLRRHRMAIGYRTSALVTAGLEGLEVICKDKRNIMSEPNWVELLAYTDWRWSEIWDGTAWGTLCSRLQH